MSFFSGKCAFITGGSSGIGKAAALLLASQGCGIVLFARGKAGLDRACDDIKKRISDTAQLVEAVIMDVSDSSDVDQKIKTAVELYGVPDILINSAGVGYADYFENSSHDNFDKTMKTNVYGTWNSVSAMVPFMKEKGGGHIVNISSVAGLIGMFGYSVYCTTKYALVGMSECLRSELKRFNINLTLVCPPEVETPFVDIESKTLPPEGRAVKSLAGLLKPEKVALSIVRGIKRKQFLVVPGAAARLLYFWHRMSNGYFTRMPSDMITAYISRKTGK